MLSVALMMSQCVICTIKGCKIQKWRSSTNNYAQSVTLDILPAIRQASMHTLQVRLCLVHKRHRLLILFRLLWKQFGICAKCVSSCSTCVTDITTCTSCIPKYYLLETSSNPCKDGCNKYVESTACITYSSKYYKNSLGSCRSYSDYCESYTSGFHCNKCVQGN